jgi:uncharacterized protein
MEAGDRCPLIPASVVPEMQESKMMRGYEVDGRRLKLFVRARPNARNTCIRAVDGGEVLVDLSAPPEDNKANKELVRFMSKAFGVSRSSVEIIAGATSTKKVVIVELGEVLDVEEVLNRSSFQAGK